MGQVHGLLVHALRRFCAALVDALDEGLDALHATNEGRRRPSACHGKPYGLAITAEGELRPLGASLRRCDELQALTGLHTASGFTALGGTPRRRLLDANIPCAEEVLELSFRDPLAIASNPGSNLFGAAVSNTNVVITGELGDAMQPCRKGGHWHGLPCSNVGVQLGDGLALGLHMREKRPCDALRVSKQRELRGVFSQKRLGCHRRLLDFLAQLHDVRIGIVHKFLGHEPLLPLSALLG
mmetsp:Transcript_16288/g.46374  ORF Transcript_16288/g.46374 Transcript_16288/m.46374 type:complete len:240 (+) Transcript_16288:661-1380(+)